MVTEKHEGLGTDVLPIAYRLRFEPDMEKFTFSCYEEIDIDIKEDTSTIKINGKELKVQKVQVLSQGKVYDAHALEDPKNETIAIRIGSSIRGKATIKAQFTGINNDRMYGFYRSSYKNGKGKMEYLLTTQFEAADARAAFLCFDEPAFKATYELSLLISNDLDAVSNMPIESIEPAAQGKKLVKFMKTPKMSTYLLYIGIGRFEYLQGKLGKMPVRVITVPGKRIYASTALDLAKKFVMFYEKYFGIKYPMPKLDLLAIPDFAAGAMENWGAITFREIELLVDKKKTSKATLQRVANTIAHELAHQWFGDLVTMEWWNDLWLNESFATFMSYKAVDHVFPDWEIDTQSFLEINGVALAADELANTHPISVIVERPSQIDQIFDEISYEKGGSVLRMIEDYVGEENFRKGLHEYLKEHAYSNATKYDLWDAIDKVAKSSGSKIDAMKVASAWIDMTGYPYISTSRKQGKGIAIKQGRFALSNVHDSSIWPIPVHYLDGSDVRFEMFDKKDSMIYAKSSLAKLNYGQKGVYRVAYEKNDLEAIGLAIRDGRLSNIDSWGVENDLYAFVYGGMASLDEYLQFVEKYCSNASYPMSLSIALHLMSLFTIFYPYKKSEQIRGIAVKYYNSMLSKIGMKKEKGEKSIITMLRSSLLSGLGIMEPEGRAAAMLKKEFVNKLNGKAIDSNISGAVYTTAAFNGNASTLSQLINLYKKEALPEEQRKILGSMGFFSEISLLRKALDFSIGESVRFQDSYTVAVRASANPVAPYVLLEWEKKNWKALMKRYNSGTHMLSSYVDALACLRDKEALESLKGFFARKENMREDISMAVAQAIEIVDAKSRLISKNIRL
ncbi:MAG: M1 family metallopeptidase [Candidatus Micrarchaeia archaeon]